MARNLKLDEPARSTRVMGGARALQKKTARDRAREPRPLNRGIGIAGGTEIDGPSANVVHIDAQTGAAFIEKDGHTIIDMAGRDTAADQKPQPFGDNFDENLALRLDVPLATIAFRLLEEIDAAVADRSEWEETGNRGVELLGVKWEEATAQPGSGGTISKAHHPMLLEAVLRSWANSRAELLPAGGPVKVRDDQAPAPPMALPNDQMSLKEGGDSPPTGPGIAGAAEPPTGGPGIAGGAPPPAAQPQATGAPAAPDMPDLSTLPPEWQDAVKQMLEALKGSGQMGGKRARSEKAEALEKDMNHYLTTLDREYYPDTSKMLVTRALKGTQFKKVYKDPLLRKPVSRWVKGTDLIVSNDGSSLSGVSLKAEQSLVREATVKRMQKIGHWRTVSLNATPVQQPTQTEQATAQVEGVKATSSLPRKGQYRFYECYVELDDGPLGKDENGAETDLCLPYRATLERESRQIVEIRRNWKKGDKDFRERQRYVKYGFLPGLGFYDWGYLHVLGSPERAATAMLREFIDAEMLASFPGGVMQQQAGQNERTNNIRPGIGEFVVVNTGGAPLDDFVKPWVYKGASPQLTVALDHVTQHAKQLTGALEMPVGEGRAGLGQTPVGTIMAFIDAVSKVPSAIHKDDHMSQQQEFELLKELLEESPECLQSPDGRKWTEQELADQRLVPAADPNTPSAMHRIMQGAALVEVAGLPIFQGIANPRAIWKIVLGILGIGEHQDVTLPEHPQGSPPPDPKALSAMAKAKNDEEKNKLAAAKLEQEKTEIQRKAASDSVEAEQRQQDRQAQSEIENQRLDIERERTAREHAKEVAAEHVGHDREVGGAIAEHVRETRAQDIDHQQHRETLAQDDQHHREELAAAERQRQHEAAQSERDRQHQAAEGAEGRRADVKKAAAKPKAKPKPKGKAK